MDNNGTNGTDHPEVPKVEAPEPEAPRENTAVIKGGTMTLTLELERSGSAFAEAIGSLDLAKDLVKQYYGRKAIADAAIRERHGIIKPGIQ